MEGEGAGKKVFFISHSSKDINLAEAVRVMLINGFGIKNEAIFYSGNVKNSPSVGSKWFDEIIKSLSETTVLILILTENFFKSNFCVAELSAAIMADSQEKIFIPFQVAKDISHMGNVLGKYQSCRFDKGNFEVNFEKLIVDIEKHLRNLEKVIPGKEWRDVVDTMSQATNLIGTQSELQKLIGENKNHQETQEKKKEYCKQNTLLCEELRDSLLFNDTAETIKLVRSQDELAKPIISSNFFEHAGNARKHVNCTGSMYVLPLTTFNIDFFVKSINDKYEINKDIGIKSDWFKEELELGHAQEKDGLGRPVNVRRIVIIADDSVHNDNRDAIITFFKRYTSHNWRIMFRTELGMMQKHFREFCVFNYKDCDKSGESKESYQAFFTYLDKDHNNIFTKGAWTQYYTENENYIKKLIDTFETLWGDPSETVRRGKTIEEFLSKQK